MLILGIETSCDETAVAIVKNGRLILSNVVSSQMKIHSPYGGVVPELASRAHLTSIIPVLHQSLSDAKVKLNEITAIAVTLGPGLIGSLLVGVETAKVISYIYKLPFIPINHLAGHLYTPFLEDEKRNISPKRKGRTEKLKYPYMGLVVSGGHTCLVIVHKIGKYQIIGETLDDAAGEAYDKVAKLLGLCYPGGPIIDRISQRCPEPTIKFPRPLLKSKNYNFSFSGLKTAVLTYVKKVGLEKVKSDKRLLTEICAGFQEAVIETLVKKSSRALQNFKLKNLAIVGGVAANIGLRNAIQKEFAEINYFIPPPILCTDNAAMIAGVGYEMLKTHNYANPDFSINADTNLRLDGWGNSSYTN